MDVERLKKILYEAYDIDEEYNDQEKGCFVNGYWLSIDAILDEIKNNY